MNKQTLKLSDYYIKRTKDDEGYVKSDGSLDDNKYALSGHVHSKADIDFTHAHGNINYNGTLANPETSSSAMDTEDYILFADKSQNNIIKGVNKVSDYLITHDSPLDGLDIDNSSVSQHTINRVINSKIKTMNTSLDEKANTNDINDMIRDYIQNNMVDLFYPIGSIYMSVVETSPATLFGGQWNRLEDRFLLGAGSKYTRSSGSNKNDLATGGSADAVIVNHNHTQKSHTHIQSTHTHIQNSHTHSQDSHNHSQDSHNHSQNAHNHTTTSADNGYKFLLSDGNIAVNSTPRGAVGGDGDWHYVYAVSKTGWFGDIIESANTAKKTATNKATTAVNQPTVATNQPTTAINQSTRAENEYTSAENNPTGVSGVGANMPPYQIVYMWERIA